MIECAAGGAVTLENYCICYERRERMRILLGAMILFVLLFVNCATDGSGSAIESVTVGGEVRVRAEHKSAD